MQDPAGFALLKASPNVFCAIQTSCKERSLNIKFISGQWIIDSLLRIWGGFRTLSNSRRRIQSNVWSIRKLQSTKCRTHVESYDSMDHVQTSSITFCYFFSGTCGTFNPSKISYMTEFQTCRGALWEVPKPRNVAMYEKQTLAVLGLQSRKQLCCIINRVIAKFKDFLSLTSSGVANYHVLPPEFDSTSLGHGNP